MSLRVYNSLTEQKELFEPVRPGKVGMYLCGPTVYKSPHIGHMVGPVIFDAIKRYLVHKGYEVHWVVNITDVEDKLIDESRRSGLGVREIADKYTAEYMDCLRLLGIDTIDRFPKASEHIQEIIDLTVSLIDRDHAYAAEGGDVYFDVTSDPDYGKLSHRKLDEQEAGLREVAGSDKKKHPADFALWKAAKPGEPAWDSPWGPGRPGWHIECSAMAMKYLGETFDFHGGGMDLKFPHHENELAQSECATGRTFARYWLHNGLTRMKTKMPSGEWKMEKQSKSLGNVIDPRELIAEHGADLVRYLLISTHYRRPIEFTDEVLAASQKGLATFTRLFERVERINGAPIAPDAPAMDQVANALLETQFGDFARRVLGYKMKFLEMMDDDFNTAGAIAAMHELAGEINAFTESQHVEREKVPEKLQATSAAAVTLKKLLMVLGFCRAESAKPARSKDTELLGKVVQLLMDLRAEARTGKNFALADQIRKGLAERGIALEDRAEGTVWRRE